MLSRRPIRTKLLAGLVLLVSLFNDRGRCLHDILCGTVVVNVLDRPEIVDARH